MRPDPVWQRGIDRVLKPRWSAATCWPRRFWISFRLFCGIFCCDQDYLILIFCLPKRLQEDVKTPRILVYLQQS